MKINPNIFLLLVIFITFSGALHLHADDQILHNKDQRVDELIHVGLILDMESLEGKVLQSCISMAISDFYSEHSHYRTRVVLHFRDSKGEPLLALSSALDLLKNLKVRAIIGAQTSWEAKLLAELGDKSRVSVISLSPTSISPSLKDKYPYFVQMTQDHTSQAIAIADVIKSFKWKDVIIVQEGTDDWKDLVLYLDALQDKGINTAYKSIISLPASMEKDEIIIKELQKLMLLQQKVFVLHMSPLLATRFFINARNSGMMTEGYTFILTVDTMNHLLHSIGSSDADSMQGVLGLKSHVPSSKELRDFTSRWRRKLLLDHDIEVMELSVFGIWAHDAAWGLAKAAENAMTRHNHASMLSDSDLILLKEISHVRFKGLSGEFQFLNGKLVSNAYEIVNLIGNGDRRVGFWNSSGVITRELYSKSYDGRQLLEDVIWPGGSGTIPKGYAMRASSRKKLRIAVPSNYLFPELVYVDHDPQTNATIATGFCIDVFRAAMKEIQYEAEYEFIHFARPKTYGNYSYYHLIHQVYLQKFDAAVGDITITWNRSLEVDFTLPFTELGVGIIAAKDTSNMWIFLKPLTADLWLWSAGFFIFTGFIIWLIERHINKEFQGPITHQVGIIFYFSFSTLVFAHREKLVSNLSRFIIIVWVFVVLILTSSYTATLTSMITVQQINTQLNSKGSYIGYKMGSLTKILVRNLNLMHTNLKPIASPEEYVNALPRGSKNGGVTGIIDEIPYLKIFLAKHAQDYFMVGRTATSNGFGFAFAKGSPLAPQLSGAIAKMREDGRLAEMENEWFKSRSTITTSESDNNSNDVKPLTLDSFRGLFLITGVSSAFALFIFYCFLLHQNWDYLKNSFFCNLNLVRFEFVKQYLLAKVFRERQTNVIVRPV